VTRKLERKTTI